MNFTRENLKKTKEDIVMKQIKKEVLEKNVDEKVDVVIKKLTKKNTESVIYE